MVTIFACAGDVSVAFSTHTTPDLAIEHYHRNMLLNAVIERVELRDANDGDLLQTLFNRNWSH